MKFAFFIAAICIYLCSATISAQDITFKSHGKLVKTLSIDELKSLVGPTTVTVDDPLQKTQATYEGLDGTKVFEKIYGPQWKETEEILMTCKDGYQPSLPEKTFENYPVYFAFKKTDGTPFSLVNKLEGDKKVNLAPLYLIWKSKDATLDWAYQITTFDLIRFEEKFPQISPPTTASTKVKRGFVLFRNECLRCHTINGTGGNLAPELNYPMNVTEYYKESFFKKWLKDPQSVRFGTSMPAFAVGDPKHDEKVEDILAYLKAMKDHKLKPLPK